MGFRALDPFNPLQEDFDAYSERVTEYFLANKIEDERKRLAVLLTEIGPNIYQVLKDLVSPDTPASKSFSEVVDILKKHYKPKKLVVAEHFNFHRWLQKEVETMAQFMGELRRLAKTCQFGAFLGEELRDQFVCGLKRENKLLLEEDLTLDRALEIAQSLEAAELGTKELHRDNQLTETEIVQLVRKANKFHSNCSITV